MENMLEMFDIYELTEGVFTITFNKIDWYEQK